MQYLRAVLAVIEDLEDSDDVQYVEFWRTLAFLRWVVVREPLFMAKDCDFSRVSSVLRCYVEAMFGRDQDPSGAYLNSVLLENIFNDLRDNQLRGARHKQRSDQRLHALSLSSNSSRHAGSVQMPEVHDEDVQRFAHLHFPPHAFSAHLLRWIGA